MKLIFKNLVSLGFVQSLNLLIPLLITPFLVAKLGLSLFGVISAAQSVVGFFILLVDFGYNLTSVRRIAQARNDKLELERIVNSVFLVKLFLLVICFCLFLLIIFLVPHFHKHFFIYACSFSMVVGYSFLPIWYFQGTEKINKTIIPVTLFKVATVVSIFYFVKLESDAAYVNLLLGAGNLLTGAVLYFQVFREYKFSFQLLNVATVKTELKDNFPLFFSNLSVLLYANSSLLILSFFLVPEVLGIYSIVDKIIQMVKAILGLVHQVVYPRLCNIVTEAAASLPDFLRKIYAIVWVGILIVCCIMFLESNLLVSYFVDDATYIPYAAKILRYFSFIFIIIGLNMPFYQTLLAYRKDWFTVRVLFAGSIISIVLNIILVPVLNLEGSVITMYIVESLVTASLFYGMKQLKINYGHR